MIKKIFGTAALCLILWSCSDGEKKAAPVTDTDVAEAFIRATLDNDLDNADKYLLKDEMNQQYMDAYRRESKRLSAEERQGYKKASIIIREVAPVVNDSVTVISYSNSYKSDKINKLKLVRTDGKWLIDFKYTFSGNL